MRSKWRCGKGRFTSFKCKVSSSAAVATTKMIPCVSLAETSVLGSMKERVKEIKVFGCRLNFWNNLGQSLTGSKGMFLFLLFSSFFIFFWFCKPSAALCALPHTHSWVLLIVVYSHRLRWPPPQHTILSCTSHPTPVTFNVFVNILRNHVSALFTTYGWPAICPGSVQFRIIYYWIYDFMGSSDAVQCRCRHIHKSCNTTHFYCINEQLNSKLWDFGVYSDIAHQRWPPIFGVLISTVSVYTSWNLCWILRNLLRRSISSDRRYLSYVYINYRLNVCLNHFIASAVMHTLFSLSSRMSKNFYDNSDANWRTRRGGYEHNCDTTWP